MKRVSAVLLSDPHLDKDNGELVKYIFRQAFELCVKKKTDNLIVAGDLFTNRSAQPLTVLTTLQEIVQEALEAGVHMFLIPGNHDKTDPNANESYLDLYNQFPNVDVFRTYNVHELRDVAFHFMPYYKEEKWAEDFKPKFVKGEPNILITHIGFDGVKNNDGSEVVSPVKPSDFKRFDKVLIGHYHDASKLGTNVYYVGSAYQNNFGENITDKGFTLIYDDGSTQFVPSIFPKYIKKVIDVNDIETTRNLIEEYSDNTDDFIRFVFRGKKQDCNKVAVSTFQKWGIDVKFEIEETTEAIEASESDAVLLYDKKTIVRDFMAFCKENEIKGEKLTYGLKLVNSITYVES